MRKAGFAIMLRRARREFGRKRPRAIVRHGRDFY
jgi:hypothetical protein